MMRCNIGGWVLIGLGSMFLLQNLGIISLNIFKHLWPLILIAVGIGIIFKKTTGKI